MVSLTNLVEVSEKVGSTTKKKEKVTLLADFLKRARGKEITLAASYLSGQIPQGRLGIGWATIQGALQGLAEKTRSLSLMEIDQSFGQISRERGTGSAERRLKHLQDLFSGTKKEERDFLIRLIMGESRQGALEGPLVEALAVAHLFLRSGCARG